MSARWRGNDPARLRPIALLELTAPLATLAMQLGHHAHGRPVGVFGDRLPGLSFPLFVGGFWRVPELLRSPEHASKLAWHTDFATPRVLLSIRHLKAPFRLGDSKLQRWGVGKLR
jgi:hypothetical protein